MNMKLIYFGFFTMLVASIQVLFSILGIMQLAGMVDLLQGNASFLWMRLLFFHNPAMGTRINIGYVEPSIPDQSFIVIREIPSSTSNHFIISLIYLSTGGSWMLGSVGIIKVGIDGSSRGCSYRTIWLLITLLITFLDVVVAMMYLSILLKSQTLNGLAVVVGGFLNGTTGTGVDTSLASYIMFIYAGRYGIIALINLGMIAIVMIDTARANSSDGDSESYFPPDEMEMVERAPEPLPRPRIASLPRTSTTNNTEDDHSVANTAGGRTPPPPPPLPSALVLPKSSVKFPETLLSVTQRTENLMSVPSKHQPKSTQLDPVPSKSTSLTHIDAHGRRGTAIELQSQKPWTYTTPTVNRMRDQLPADEELPPVPVPDYTLHKTYRKASVHRAGSMNSAETSSKVPQYLSNGYSAYRKCDLKKMQSDMKKMQSHGYKGIEKSNTHRN